jgi:hypothetical protein
MKPELRIINSPLPPEPPDYARVYSRLIQECTKAENPSTDWKKRFVYLVIKGLPVIFDDVISEVSKRYCLSRELLSLIWAPIELAEEQMGHLTPNEFMTVFPIKKEYDGHRYGVKDYHSTMEELEKIGMDTQIGENVQSLLFDYQNKHVVEFNVFKMVVVDRIRACQGQPSMVEAFMSEQGIYPMRMMTDDNGKQFMYDPYRQTSYPIVKMFPRYLKVIR